MSTFCFNVIKCGLCGHKFKARRLSSTNAFGSPDLDLRPPEMERSAMRFMLSKCPKCGYVHTDIEADGSAHKALVKSKAYRMCEGANLMSGMARDFYRYAMILLNEENEATAYSEFLCAAWFSDDQEDEEGAEFCREKAIALYEKNNFGKENEHLALRHIDVLRRAGHFEEAKRLCEETDFDEELERVVAFQKFLLESKDRKCYLLEDCRAARLTLREECFNQLYQAKRRRVVYMKRGCGTEIAEGAKMIFRNEADPSKTMMVRVYLVRQYETLEELRDAGFFEEIEAMELEVEGESSIKDKDDVTVMGLGIF